MYRVHNREYIMDVAKRQKFTINLKKKDERKICFMASIENDIAEIASLAFFVLLHRYYIIKTFSIFGLQKV